MKLVIITTIDGDLLAMSKADAMEYILAHGTNSDGSSVATIEEATVDKKLFMQWLEKRGYTTKSLERLELAYSEATKTIERLQDELYCALESVTFLTDALEQRGYDIRSMLRKKADK